MTGAARNPSFLTARAIACFQIVEPVVEPHISTYLAQVGRDKMMKGVLPNDMLKVVDGFAMAYENNWVGAYGMN